MPEKLNEVAHDRLTTRVPREYIKRTIASVLACKVQILIVENFSAALALDFFCYHR